MKYRSGFVSNSSSSSFIFKGHLDQKFIDFINHNQIDILDEIDFLSRMTCECPLRNTGSHYMSCNAWKAKFYEKSQWLCIK